MTQDQLVDFPSVDYIQGEHFDIEKLAFFKLFLLLRQTHGEKPPTGLFFCSHSFLCSSGQ